MTEGWNAPVSDYAAPVIDNDQPVSAYSKRKEQTRQAVRHYRRRRQHGICRRPIDITDAQLDALVARGYLDPDRRGDTADECDAIEMFLIDALTTSR